MTHEQSENKKTKQTKPNKQISIDHTLFNKVIFCLIVFALEILPTCHFNLYLKKGLADENIALGKPTKMFSIYDPNIHDGSHYICCDSDFGVDETTL